MYTTPATSKTPALIILLLDESLSMTDLCGPIQRITAVENAVKRMIQRMIMRSARGMSIAPRYRLAIFSYSDEVSDWFGGAMTIDKVAQLELNKPRPINSTNTAAAFQSAETLLLKELPKLKNSPAPLIVHLTDGEYNGNDPTPIIKRIQKLANNDGPVLVENIFISNNILSTPVTDLKAWKGIVDRSELKNATARTLFDFSSPLPASYRSVLKEWGYQFSENARMMMPGMSPELVELGFVLSAATPIKTPNAG